MKSMVKSIAALAASVAIATASLTGVAAASVQSLESNVLVKNNDLWTAEDYSIHTDDLNTYMEGFRLDHSQIVIGVDGGRQTSKLTADKAYAGNYKWTCLSLEGSDGYATKYTPERDRNKQTVSTQISYGGDVTSGKYYSYLYDGTGESSYYLERSSVFVNVDRP